MPNFLNPYKILPQTSPNSSQTFPKPFQNRIQTFPNQRKLQLQPRKQEKFNKKRAPLNDCKALGAHFGGPKLPKRGPRGSQNLQNGAQNVKKSKLQNKSFSDSIFSSILSVFSCFFRWSLKAKRQKRIQTVKNDFTENLKNRAPV